ncbi:suppressor of tumorigenicity protein 13 [Angomonas deanei]|uniref:Tetratricopeptide repeat/STI1 domain containing protein, putative n=1 Tax=Angomonas deanei TaxID=59799 RepID=A0A7G2C0W0_9TRYP|nr:suppressor of tumorigenicity protein 13 [Angomonas deanei]CAD2213418.1 Tetratricopeptide repeat/STI1 domain containing protein, putative [Angomonas deanei]|eukprot:EPY38167.1 suppressor of tumorigenicity protein 13 [Angomonas deanei]
MSISPSDAEVIKRVVSTLNSDPQLIHATELAPLRQWAAALGAVFPEPAKPAPEEAGDAESEEDEERWALEAEEPENIPAIQGEPSDEATEKAMALKGEAADLAADNKYEEAVAKMGEALKLNPGNAMYWGLRSLYFLKLNRPRAALTSANRALEINPQNVRALRVRGTVNRHLGRWKEALKDLSDAQAIDYDDAINEIMRFVQERLTARHQRDLQKQTRLEEEAARRRQEELHQRQSAQASAPPTGAAPGGMPGGIPPQMASMFQDPEILTAMQDPEVAAKLSQAMSNPMMLMELSNDPKVGPILEKMMSKMMGGGGMPGMGGMPPGMGGAGMPPGMGGAQPDAGVGKNDDLD